METSIESSTRTRLKRSPAVPCAYATFATFNRRVSHPAFATLFGEVQVPGECTF